MTTASATASLSASTAPSTSRPRRRLGRSIGAVAAGLVTIVVTSTAADMVLHAAGVYPPFGQRMSDGLFLLATAYRVLFGIGGEYLTARLAPNRPMGHAVVLAGVGTVLSIAGAVAMGDKGPAWYALAVIAMCFPCAWVGARLARRGSR